MFDKNWQIREVATYHDGEIRTRVVESGLSRRRAAHAVPQWQAASNKNKLLVQVAVPAGNRKPLPDVVYVAVQS